MDPAPTDLTPPLPHAQPTLAVVVPATDAPATLERCLAALGQSSRAPDELHVVGAGDTDLPGPAAARNAGAAVAGAEVLVFIDSDVEPAADALARIASAFASQPDLCALFGAYDDAPAAPGIVSRFRNLLHHHVHATAAGPATTFWAGLGAVRAEAFDDVGGFDAVAYPAPSIEDLEFGGRLSAAGKRILLDPKIRGRHLKRWSLVGMMRSDLLDRGAPWTRLLLERGVDSATLNLGLRHRASALLSLVAAASFLRRRPALAVVALLAMIGLNTRFYALLRRRLGDEQLAAGIALHALHHLTAIASVPVGVLQHLGQRSRTPGDS